MGRGDETITELLKGIAVLVVDDDPDARAVYQGLLQYAGALVFTVRSAEAGLRVLARIRPDVIISDLRMPRRDGYWFMRKVRMLPPDRGATTPAIAVTGHHPYVHDVMRAADAGFNAHLTKPVDPHVLWRAVLQVTEGRGRGVR